MNALGPAVVAAEALALSGLVQHPHLFDRVRGRLTPRHFTDSTHRNIFTSMLACKARGEVLDVANVSDAMYQVAGLTANTQALLPLFFVEVREDEAAVELGLLCGATPEPEPDAGRFMRGLDLGQFNAGAFLDAPMPDLVWVFEGFLLTANVSLLVGPPGTGKSYLALQLAAALAGGRGAQGILSPGARGRVLVLAGEEDARIVPRRLKSIREQFYPDSDPDALNGFRENFIVLPLAGKTLRLIEKTGSGAPVESQLFVDLLELCGTIPDLRLIVVDPVSRAYGLNELDNSDNTAFIVALEKLAQATGAGVVAIHHTNKAASSRRGADAKKGYLNALEQEAARGGTGLVGAVRAQVNVVGLKQEEARALFRDHAAEDNHYLAVGFPKCSYGPPRPVLFLHRGPGGVLLPVERPAEARERETRELILEWLIAKIEAHRVNGLANLTQRSILDFSNEWAGIPGASKAEVKATIGAALSTGELIEVPGKTPRGREVEYLALPPRRKGQKSTPAIPASIPASTDTGQTGQTGQTARPVCPPNNSNRFHTGQKSTPAKEPETREPAPALIPETGQTGPSKEGEEVGACAPFLPPPAGPPEPPSWVSESLPLDDLEPVFEEEDEPC